MRSYTPSGRVHLEYLPAYAGESPIGYTQHSYDFAGRPFERYEPDGTRYTNIYIGLETTVRRNNVPYRKYVTDTGGRLLQTAELPRRDPETGHYLPASSSTFAYDPFEFGDTLRAIAESEIDVTPMITGTCGIEGVPAAFDALGRPDEHVKILVEPGGPAVPTPV